MPVFKIKQGDRKPPLKVLLLKPDGTAIAGLDGAGTSLRYVMEGISGGAVTVNDASTAEVQYPWAAGDTDKVGKFEGAFLINWSDGQQQTVPNSDEDKLYVQIDRKVGG